MKTLRFRRFTYLATMEHAHIHALTKQIKTKEIQGQLKKEGIFTFEIHQRERQHLVLVDTDASFNAEMLFHRVQKLEAFNSFQSVLTPHKALERIFELEQKEIHSPTDGQLKTSVKPHERFVWTLQLDPELVDEYKRVHGIGQAWPEITGNMKTVGVKDMEIYLSGAQAFLIMDTVPDFNLEETLPKWQKLPREEEWQTHVAQFQRTDPNSAIQEKWKDMNNVLSNES